MPLGFGCLRVTAAAGRGAVLAKIAIDRLINRFRLGPTGGGVVEINALHACQPPIWYIARWGRTNCGVSMPWPIFLAPTQLDNQRRDLLIAAAAAQKCPGIPFDGRKQTVSHLPFGRQSQAIAIAAKGLRDRIDEADAAAAIGVREIGRRLAGIVDWQRLERPDFVVNDLPNLRAAKHLVVIPMMFGIERHVLDESQFQAVLAGELRQRHDFLFGDAANRNRIQADL